MCRGAWAQPALRLDDLGGEADGGGVRGGLGREQLLEAVGLRSQSSSMYQYPVGLATQRLDAAVVEAFRAAAVALELDEVERDAGSPNPDAASASAVPSVDALSTTMTRSSGCV
jgi:hypothetical protein